SGLVPGFPPEPFATAFSPVVPVRGIFDSRPLFACLSATAFLLFAATRALEARRWTALPPRGAGI
ncbi:MAG: hypothetical protein IJ678_03630, partial [Kiritimatiellae bacterium]|nr:hypothetical protein [Kiritimatiellia bacterium]